MNIGNSFRQSVTAPTVVKVFITENDFYMIKYFIEFNLIVMV